VRQIEANCVRLEVSGRVKTMVRQMVLILERLFRKTIFFIEYQSIRLMNQSPGSSIECSVGNKGTPSVRLLKSQKQIALDRYSDELLNALAESTGGQNERQMKQIFCNQADACHCWKGFTGNSCDERKYS
jgi:hypothetical protein